MLRCEACSRFWPESAMPRPALEGSTCPACGGSVRPVAGRPRRDRQPADVREGGSTARALEDRLTAYCG